MLFELGKVYNFYTISSNILKPYYKNMKAVGYMSYNQAIKYSGVFNDVITLRDKLIKETGKTLVEPKLAKYVLFEDEFGGEILLAEDWIKTDSIEQVSKVNAIVEIEDISTSDLSTIRDMLESLGFKLKSIRTN